jgi:hypothetical protein
MTLGQHFIISWVVANAKQLDHRSRIFITAAGVLPDIDGFGYPIDKLGEYLGYSTTLFEDYHHYLGHNIFFGVIFSLIFARFCRERLAVLVLCLAAFHLHLLGDLIGSRGPDGYQWPILYLYPLVSSFELTWTGQWELSSWRNSAIGVLFFFASLLIARYRCVTFFELFSLHFENKVKEAAQRRGFFKSNPSLNRTP